MLRLERRQWTLVIVLIAVAVAGGVFAVTAAINVIPQTRVAEFGHGSHMIGVPGEIAEAVAADAKSKFAAADAVATSFVRPAGSASPVEVRAFNPDGANSAALIDLLEGRYPSAETELAVTGGLAERLGATIGDAVRLDGSDLIVTGLVENPARLSDQFVLAQPGVFVAEEARILISGSDTEVRAFLDGWTGSGLWQQRIDDNSRTATAIALTVAMAGILLEVGLLVISVVTMLAQRRLRQLGLLAAIGANRRQLRAAVVAGGITAGIIAATVGVAAGMAASQAVVPGLDDIANYRIEAVQWPWAIIAVMGIMAIVAAAGAAWWPARTMTKAAVAGALKAARPAARPPVRMSVLGIVLLVVGVVGLVSVFSMEDRDRPVFLDVAAFVAIPLGTVLLAPLAVRVGTRRVGVGSLATRVARRDLGRYQSRSAATAAALIVVLTIPVVAATGFRIFEQSDDHVPSMAPNHLMVFPESDPRFGPLGPVADDAVDRSVFTDEVADLVPGTTVVPLLQPIVESGTRVAAPTSDAGLGEGAEVAIGLRSPLVFGLITERSGSDFGFTSIPTYVGTPDLVTALGLSGMGDAEVITNRDGEHAFIRPGSEDVGTDEGMSVSVLDFERFLATPGALIEPGYAESFGLPIETVAWLVVADTPFADADIADITRTAASLGVAVEGRTEPDSGTRAVAWTLGVSGLLAVGIVAVVGALHRAENASAHAAYEAIGAGRSFRRRVHAWSMGSLALAAAVLAVMAGLLSQVGFAVEVLGAASLWKAVPPLVVGVVLLGIPLVAYAFGWFTGLAEPARTDLGR